MKFTQATIILALLNTSANAALRGRQTRSNGQTEAYRQQEEAIQSDIVFEEIPDEAYMTADMGGEDPEMELEMKVEMLEVEDEEGEEEIPVKSDAEIVYKEGLAPPDINDMGEGDGLDKCDGLMAADSPEYAKCMEATTVTPIKDGDEAMKIMGNDEIPVTNPDMASAAQKFTFEDEEVDSMGETPDEPIPTYIETGEMEMDGKKFSIEMEDEEIDSMGETPDEPIPTYTESTEVVESDTGKKFSFDTEDVDVAMDKVAGEVFNGHHVVTKSITYEFDDGSSVTETIREHV